jgi:hypothetical protein
VVGAVAVPVADGEAEGEDVTGSMVVFAFGYPMTTHVPPCWSNR